MKGDWEPIWFPFILIMKYHYEIPEIYSTIYGDTYKCEHPLYTYCTLYLIGVRGLAVIQQDFDPVRKITWWREIDPWFTDDIYLSEDFKAYFDERAKEPVGGLYPTVTLRQIMWALKIKPMKKEPWETVFDRKFI
jgi:hypothetical protein